MINSQNIPIQNSGDTRDNPPPLQQTQNYITSQQNPNSLLNPSSNNNINNSNNNNNNLQQQNVMMAQPILYDENGNNPNPNYFQFLYGHDKWPQNVERAFTAALKLIVKSGTSKTKIRNKNYGRNELISLYIRYHTGEIRTKKQISSHIQVWKKSILSKVESDVNLTPLDTEVLSLIENGAEQNEKSLSLFYSVFDEIIDAMTKDKNYQKFKNTITDRSRNNDDASQTHNSSANGNSPNNMSGSTLLYQQRQPQQLVQVQGQPMMVQEGNINGSPTYSIIQSVPMLFVQDNQQPNILRPVTYSDGSHPMMTRGPQQRPEWGYNNNNNQNNNGNQNNTNGNNNNNYLSSYTNGNRSAMPYQYEQPSYYYTEKSWTMPTNNPLSSSSSSSSSGSTVSYPQWGAASLSIQNSDNTPSTASTRTQEVLPSTSNILSSLSSSNDGISQSTLLTNNSDNILNSIAAATTHSTSISQNDNERPRLPPVSQNQFFRANNNMLKSAVLPPIQYSSSPMSSSRNNTNNNSSTNGSNNNNDSTIHTENRKGYPKSMSSLGSTSTENRMNNGNNINKKSQLSPHNIPTSLNRQFSSNKNNVTILPSISAYRLSENDNNSNATNTRV